MNGRSTEQQNNLYPLEMVDFNNSHTDPNTNLQSFNFSTIELIFRTLELLVKKKFREQIKKDQIEYSFKVVETQNTPETLEMLNFRYIIFGKDLKTPYEISKRDINDLIGIITEKTRGTINTSFIDISNRTELFTQIRPIISSVVLNKKKETLTDDLNTFCDELLDCFVSDPILYCPRYDIE